MRKPPTAIVIGAGPAGLMAAETLAGHGISVDVFDAMPSVARKLLIAGVGGLNLTHSEPLSNFVTRYRERADEVAAWLARFDADALRTWAASLDVATFVGSSGRVFPLDMKAAPLLRHWLRRLKASGVRIHLRQRWLGFAENGGMRFRSINGDVVHTAEATVLALGGGSWSRLGSDGQWCDLLRGQHIDVAPLQPANCGFDVDWSDHFRQRHAGQPVKPVRLTAATDDAGAQGEFVITRHGIEGSLVYSVAAQLRERIASHGSALIYLDLLPGRSLQRLESDLAKPRGSRSLSEHLRRHAGIEGVKSGLLYEVMEKSAMDDASRLAATIKKLPLTLRRARPLEEAISSAGGVRLEALDKQLMIRQLPGVFCAGEMLDWEAPTGGYLLTACMASGVVAGAGAAAWISARDDAGGHS